MNFGDKSFFISFEGIEGSGKTTQINFLKQKLESKGFEVLSLREPGGTTFGETLRNAILTSEVEVHPLAEALLFASSRAQLLHQKIIPFLAQNKKIVIVDRYVDSTYAYQGFARKLGAEFVTKLHSEFPLKILPQITFYLHIDLETSMHRQAQRGNTKDYYEKQNQDFYHTLIKGYDFCAKEFSQRVVTIDATKTIEHISIEIEKSCLQRLKI